MPSTHLQGLEEELHLFLTSELDRNERLTSRPGHFNSPHAPSPGKRWVGELWSCSGRFGEHSTVLFLKGSEPRVVQSVI